MLDLRTLALVNMLGYVAFALATLTVWRLLPTERSLRDWATGAMLAVASTLLLGLRGIAPDFLSIVVANSALVLGLGFLHRGTRRLFGLDPGRPWHWLAAAAMFLACIVFSYLVPSVPARIVTLSGLLVPFLVACAWLFWRHEDPRLKAIDRVTALIFSGGAILFIARMATAFGSSVSADYVLTPSWIVASPYFYSILFSVWMAIMLALKASARLHGQLAATLERAEEANRELVAVLDFNETVLLNSPLPMGVYAASGECVLANDAFAELVGATRPALLAQNFRNIDTWKKSGLLDDCLSALEHHGAKRREVHIVSTFGKEIWVECRILPTHLKGENHLLIQFFDLTERRRREEALHNLAFHDSLTGLPNRRLLLDRLAQAQRASKRETSRVAVLFLDLNRFKELNDAHGHDIGDQLLVEVAKRLSHLVRETDTVARIGGDEFVVLLERLGAEPMHAAENAASVADKIRRALSAEYTLGGVSYQGSASVGTKLFLGDGDDPEQILKEADIAMYEDKRATTV